jgi:hypothetical protein
MQTAIIRNEINRGESETERIGLDKRTFKGSKSLTWKFPRAEDFGAQNTARPQRQFCELPAAAPDKPTNQAQR